MRGARSAGRRALSSRGAKRRGICTFALLAMVAAPAGAQSVDDATELLRAGKYQDAAAAFAKVPLADSEWVTAQRLLVKSLTAVGKYDEAETAARRATSAPKGAQLWNTLGEVLRLRGKNSEAEQAFARARTSRASDSLTADLNLAILHYDRGDRDQALKEFDRFIDVYNGTGGSSLSADQLTAVAIACRYLGSTNPQLFKDAPRLKLIQMRSAGYDRIGGWVLAPRVEHNSAAKQQSDGDSEHDDPPRRTGS